MSAPQFYALSRIAPEDADDRFRHDLAAERAQMLAPETALSVFLVSLDTVALRFPQAVR